MGLGMAVPGLVMGVYMYIYIHITIYIYMCVCVCFHKPCPISDIISDRR
jgi:hypothetical protein